MKAHHALALLTLAVACASPAQGAEADVERVVIDGQFPGAYQVEVADVNGDGKPDVVAVGGGTCAWYENPTWRKRLVSTPKQTPDVISSATLDLDGDGKAEVAIAYDFEMNAPKRGKLLLARQGKTSDDAWTYTPVANLPSLHRLRWGDMEGEGLRSLVAAPIFGPDARPPSFDQSAAVVTLFLTGNSADPSSWKSHTIGSGMTVLHAIEVIDPERRGRPLVLMANNLGVSVSRTAARSGLADPPFKGLPAGAPGKAPKKGASEVHLGRLKDGRRFIATVEPWHGTDVAVYLSDGPTFSRFGAREVIDSTLKEGHALWVADVDRDGDDEVFAGFRGPGTSVLMFDFNGKTWDRTVLDAHVAAQDLRGGDIDGDGTPDVVAAGGSTHNVVLYKFHTKK